MAHGVVKCSCKKKGATHTQTLLYTTVLCLNGGWVGGQYRCIRGTSRGCPAVTHPASRSQIDEAPTSRRLVYAHVSLSLSLSPIFARFVACSHFHEIVFFLFCLFFAKIEQVRPPLVCLSNEKKRNSPAVNLLILNWEFSAPIYTLFNQRDLFLQRNNNNNKKFTCHSEI